MPSYILYHAQEFQMNHGVAPNVVHINPLHYEALLRDNPALFEAGQDVWPCFRMVIVPSGCLAHPEASLQASLQSARLVSRGIGDRDAPDRLSVVA